MFNKLMWKRLKDQAGMAVPMVMILMVAASLIVVPGLLVTGSMSNVNRELESSTVAYYAARSGIEDARFKFSNNVMDLEDITVNGMAVDVSKTIKAGPETIDGFTTTTYIVKSTARNETVYAEMKVTKSVVLDDGNPPDPPGEIPDPGSSGYPFWYAVASTGGNIEVNSNSHINSIPNPPNNEADVFANGELLVDTTTNCDVNGEGFYTVGSPDCTRILGGCHKSESIEFNTLDESWYWEQARLGVGYPSAAPEAIPTTYGTKTYSYNGKDNTITDLTTGVTSSPLSSVKNPTYLGGVGNISYIDGNLKLEKNFVMKGVLWVNGYISVEGLTSINTDTSKQSYLLAHGAADHGITLVTNSKIYATKNNLNLISDSGAIVIESGVDGPTVSAPVLLGIFYAPNGAITINSNSDVIASAILGKSVRLDSNIIINYDTNLRNNPPEGFEINVTVYRPAPEVDMTPF